MIGIYHHLTRRVDAFSQVDGVFVALTHPTRLHLLAVTWRPVLVKVYPESCRDKAASDGCATSFNLDTASSEGHTSVAGSSRSAASAVSGEDAT